MTIRFQCGECGARIKVSEGSGGQQACCPRCGHLQHVPHDSNTTKRKPAHGGLGPADPGPVDYDTEDALSQLAKTAQDQTDDQADEQAAGSPDPLGAPAAASTNVPEEPDGQDENQDPARPPRRRDQAPNPNRRAASQRGSDEPDPEQTADALAKAAETSSNPDTARRRSRRTRAPVGIPLPGPLPAAKRRASDADPDHSRSDRSTVPSDPNHDPPRGSGRTVSNARPKSYILLLVLARLLRIATVFLVAAAVMAMLETWRTTEANKIIASGMRLVMGLAFALGAWTLAEIAETVRDMARLDRTGPGSGRSTGG